MSKVYYTNLKTSHNNLLVKLQKLIEKAGIENINFKNKFVAIKIHFGEPGNLAYLRPNYSKVIVDKIKNLEGLPFLTDCSTLYVGRRNNALNHLEAAYENGYNPFTTNCHIIMADGIKGTDEELIDINLQYIKQAKIGKAIADSDMIISMNHFKGHELTGFGGAVKNIGMGSGSKAGKMEMHNAGKPFVNSKKCIGCKICLKNCGHNAIDINNDKAIINHSKCVGCGRCIGRCSFNAIYTNYDESNDVLNKKIVEYTYAVLKGKPNFHINFIIDVSPECDCINKNDIPIVPNIGILASLDPVALDKACVDLVNKSIKYPTSNIENSVKDKFTSIHPTTNWQTTLAYAEEIGLGTTNYELVEVEI